MSKKESTTSTDVTVATHSSGSASPNDLTKAHRRQNSKSRTHHKRVHQVRKTIKRTHHHVAVRPHLYLSSKWLWYAKWHQWRWHRLVHYTTVSGYLLLVGVVIFNIFNGPASALSTWSQSDWNGGVGSNTTNQYSAASNIDSASANKIQLVQGSNIFTNGAFNSDTSGWKSLVGTHDTSQSYSATGSAKIESGSVVPSVFYGHTNTQSITASSIRSASGDVNNDGIDDLVVTNNAAGNLSIFNGTGNGTLSSATTVSTLANVFDVKLADFNGDGWRDIVTSYNNTAGKLSVFLNDGSGGFASSTDYTGLPGGGIRLCSVEVGLVNADAYPDVVVMCQANALIYLFTNNGSGTLTLGTHALSYTPSANTAFALVDVNGDGRPEVVSSSNANCNIYVSPNTGSAFGTSSSYTISACGGSGTTGYAITSGDVNKDGYGDVIFGRIGGSTAPGGNNPYMSVFYGNSSNGISGEANYIANNGSQGIYADVVSADFTGDGYLDIALTAYVGGGTTVNYYVNNGDGTFATKVDITSGTLPAGIATIDLNVDGRPDLAVNSLTSAKISLFVNRNIGDSLNQVINVGDTDDYQLEGYVYTTGATVTSADAQLYANGVALPTTFEASMVAGWYKLTAKVTGVNVYTHYGIIAKQGKTVYVDNMKLYKYPATGELTSAVFDPGFGGAWAVLSYNTTIPSGTSIKVRTSGSSDMSGATSFSSCSPITNGADISANSCVTDGHQYIQYQVSLSSVEGESPIFTSFSLDYSAYDIIAPDSNASNIQMKKVTAGADITLNEWTNGGSPYFSWTAGEDNAGGVGLLGYCVYLGTDETADPETAKGILGTSPVNDATCPFIVSGETLDLATSGMLSTGLVTSNTAYHLRIKAIDIVGNVFAGQPEDFYFRFDNTAPTNPAYLSAPSQFINSKSATITWPSSGDGVAEDANSGVAGLQYRINNTIWYGDNHSGTGDATDILSNDGSYTTQNSPDFGHINDGINTIYFRTWDIAGNVTTSYVTVPLKVNSSGSPSEPQNVTATPPVSTQNGFSFSWQAPATFVGNASNLTYCYTINTLPSSSNCTFTAAGDNSLETGSYATQPGDNIFYVVARDESNNINYSSYSSTTFTANTPAPGMPLSTDIADVSIKAINNWRLAVTWSEPVSVGAGIATYKIFRSSNNADFTQVGSSASTAFVDSGLNQQMQYYKIKACDSANNCGAFSETVYMLPTGKFTEPAAITSEPTVSGVTTKRATIMWSTDRVSDSKVTIGTSSGQYSPSEVGNSSQVTAHKIDLDNLAAGTTYYFKARWTDSDGNTGVSQEYTFTTAPAPVLKEVSTLAVNLSGATIQFTVKDASRVEVQYGKSDSFGGIKSLNTSLSESTYEIELSGLDDGVKYLYRIIMQDSEAGTYQSSIFSFNTPPRPKISNVRFQPLGGEPTSTQRVTWETNIPTNSIVQYGKINSSGTAIQMPELKTSHEIVIRGLEDNSEYFLLAQGRDSNSNIAVSDRQTFKTALDTRPPSISEIVIEPSIRGTGSEARGQIVVSWRTDEPATSQVAFGEGSNVTIFNNRTAEDAQLTTEHLVIISDLPPSKVYSIMPISRDKSQNQSTTKSQAAIIGRASDSVLNIVLNTLRKVFGL